MDLLICGYAESEVRRAFKNLRHVYKADPADLDKVVGKLFAEATDERGVNEQQFITGLKKSRRAQLLLSLVQTLFLYQ